MASSALLDVSCTLGVVCVFVGHGCWVGICGLTVVRCAPVWDDCLVEEVCIEVLGTVCCLGSTVCGREVGKTWNCCVRKDCCAVLWLMITFGPWFAVDVVVMYVNGFGGNTKVGDVCDTCKSLLSELEACVSGRSAVMYVGLNEVRFLGTDVVGAVYIGATVASNEVVCTQQLIVNWCTSCVGTHFWYWQHGVSSKWCKVFSRFTIVDFPWIASIDDVLVLCWFLDPLLNLF